MQPVHVQALLAAVVAALLAILAGCSPKDAAPAATAASAPVFAASASADGSGRSTFKAEFVQMFEKECMSRIPADAGLSQAQKTNFCQCYAVAMADNNSDMRLTRYLAGQDGEQLKTDADNYGKSCLARARQGQ
jgi:hypothetical protein